MTVPVDATEEVDRPTWTHEALRQRVLAAGFRPIGHVFYPPADPDLADDRILYPGSDGREYAKRIREGHHVEVFATPDPSTVAEIDTRYGADLVWLASLTDAGDVLWTKNEASRKPQTRFYEPDPDEMRDLDPETRERMERWMSGFRAETLVGDADAAMHLPHPAVGFYIQVLPELELDAMMVAHLTKLKQLRGTPLPASRQLLIDATARALRVQRFRERFAVATGAMAVLTGWIALGTLVWTLFEGGFLWGAMCVLGPIALLLGVTGFFMWPVRVGIPLACWIPWPPRGWT